MKKNEIVKFYLSGHRDEDFFLDENSMSEKHFQMLIGCYHSGQCLDSCEIAAEYFEIKNYDAAKNYLVDCGLEEEKFIDDDGENDESEILLYYLWILSGDIQENN